MRTKDTMFRRCLTLLLCILGSVSAVAQHCLWYAAPAQHWHEALPLGNGFMGAMVYGGVAREEMALNEGTFWSGGPHDNNSQEALPHLAEVRQLIFDGKEEEAAGLIDKHFVKGPHGMKFLTLGSLYIEDKGLNAQDEVSDYRRQLDLQTASSDVTFTAKGTRYHRTTFTSLADRVIVVRWQAEGDKMNLQVSQRCPLPTQVEAKENRLEATIKGDDHEGIKGQLEALNQTRVLYTDGQVSSDGTQGQALYVSNAKEVVLLVAAATNFVNYHDVSGDARGKVNHLLAQASRFSYKQLWERHLKAYQPLYQRVQLHLPSATDTRTEATPTDLRLRHFDGKDLGLVSLLFHYGRYLLLSSSQPGGQAANLQGIWNASTWPAWDSKYTININAEMNYWPAEVCNLTECNVPLFDLIRDLSETGTRTARQLYDCGGWMAHHNTDIWRIAGPVDGAAWGLFPNGGAWLATHLWQHYLYTGDKEFLKQWYPVLKGAADFYLDYLQVHPRYGWLVAVPSVSPEQGPVGKRTPVTAGCTMDNQIAFDALSQALHAAEVLGEEEAYCTRLRQTIGQLPPMQIGRHKQLQEWLWDGDDPRNQHRHISHLYGLYPSNQISPYGSPALFEAAKTTLRQRGDEATGWSLGWKVNFWARMLDGDHAFLILQNLLKILPSDQQAREYPQGRMYPNLFDAHPPFQIDGNFGATAGIAELFLQSHDGAIHLLPALPAAFAEGRISGLCARGGVTVDQTFAQHRLKEATLYARQDGTLRLRSYTPLRGKGLRTAVGACPNPLLAPAKVKAPLVSAELKEAPLPHVAKVYEYDLTVRKGQRYVVKAVKAEK